MGDEGNRENEGCGKKADLLNCGLRVRLRFYSTFVEVYQNVDSILCRARVCQHTKFTYHLPSTSSRRRITNNTNDASTVSLDKIVGQKEPLCLRVCIPEQRQRKHLQREESGCYLGLLKFTSLSLRQIKLKESIFQRDGK